MNRSIIFGLMAGFSIGFFLVMILVTILSSQLSVNQTTYRHCHRSEFVLQTNNDRSFATSLMAC